MKIELRCDLCKGKGRLWLDGDDYLECTDCAGTGRVTMYEDKVRYTERTIFLPGMHGFRTLTNRLVKWG